MVTLAQQRLHTWLTDPTIDEKTKQELRALAKQPAEIEDRFYKDLEFGTGGLRGVIGAGTNRMNRYTVGKTSQGFARYLLHKHGRGSSVVIAHDPRDQSPEFAMETALVMAAHGITAYLFKSLRPTPELSFAVRLLQAQGGVMVTASHNPPEYNGYKVYDEHGGQLVPDEAKQVIKAIREIQDFSQIKRMSQQEAEAMDLLQWLGKNEDEAYVQAVLKSRPYTKDAAAYNQALKVVYTPLHGTGNRPVRDVLKEAGFKQVTVVKAQEQPDANFSTVKSPNPEEREAFALAIQVAEGNEADLILGTDPDADRMGAVVRTSDGKYEALNGNQTGALIIEYLLHRLHATGKLPDNGVLIQTIVTGELGAKIAESYGLDVLYTLTGFKYIGELMTQFEQSGKHTFLFGYEESYGYLAGTHCRDKDAIVACLLLSEASAYYKSQGLTLIDVLHQLYKRHGVFLEQLHSRTLRGKEGVARIKQTMDAWRTSELQEIAGRKIVERLDFAKGLKGLPKENVLKFRLDDGSWFCLRPSGTEPKIKVYFAVQQPTVEQAHEQMERLEVEVMMKVDDWT